MKNELISRFKILIMVFLSVVMINACDQTTPQHNAAAAGSLAVSVSLESTRAMAPDLSQDDFSFIISGNGPGENTFYVETAQGATTALVNDLVFGTWEITVEALYYGESGAVSFGDGTAAVEVHSGSMSECSVAITPFEGQGVLEITVNWDSASVENPVLEGSLSRIGSDPVEIEFTMGTGQATASLTLDSGIYTTAIVLNDGENHEFAGAADSIRIINALTTSAVYTMNGETGEGSVEISISINIPESIDAYIDGAIETLTVGTSMDLTGSAPEEPDEVYYYWYLDGRLKQEGASYTVPDTLSNGPHRVDLIVFSSDYSRGGAATCSFTVVE